MSNPRDAAAKLSTLCGDVVVTLGGDGAVWARGGEVVASIPARSVPVVDTTAAGDTFVGVLVADLAVGTGFPEALDAATVAAGIAVGRAGAIATMPSLSEISQARGRWWAVTSLTVGLPSRMMNRQAKTNGHSVAQGCVQRSQARGPSWRLAVGIEDGTTMASSLSAVYTNALHFQHFDH